ncbi:MAG: electron transfer flavoprotein subunit alpha/FixB family protein [Desulfobacterales bacterium]|nr:electron transfer flavoprotein subunit alpha/FixB family protein [Desulfobacterales bacterium]
MKKTGADENDLAGAKIVIAAGRGVGERENLARIFRFSRLFASAVVAGSRPMIDMGWMPHWRQVGVTGASISPDIYIACGISGSSQHIAGMNGSGCVIAVNNDKNAAIFNASDVCIVEDLFSFIEAFEEIAREKA